MVVGGIACTAPNYTNTASNTYLNPYNTIDANGTLTGWCFRTLNYFYPGLAKLKIFRINGSNYDYIGESPLVEFKAPETIYTGFCNISVLAGDLVGVYVIDGAVGISSSAELSKKYLNIDVTSNTPQADWANAGGKLIIRAANDYATYSNIYVDINKADDTLDGSSFANAKKTMKAGWDILNATGTMHVASGNYSAQARWTWNESWKLSPEDPNTTGEKRVVIPPST